MKEFTHDLKEIYYSSPDENAALLALNQLEEKWIIKYKPAIKPWRDNWNDLAGCFIFPEEIKKMINSTNAFEVFHNKLDKAAKIKNAYQNDNQLIEMLFLACRNTSKKWGKYPIKNWRPILAELSYFFEDRVKAYL
jgi:transposase-like protein